MSSKEIKYKILRAQYLADSDYRAEGCSHNIYDEKTQYDEHMAYAWQMHDHFRSELIASQQELKEGV